MLTENFIVSTRESKKRGQNAVKPDGIQLHEYQPHLALRKSYKNSSTNANCLSLSRTHVFAAQAEKSTVHVYNQSTGKQEATIAFQKKITCITVTSTNFPIVILGTNDGSLILWETCTGRQVSTSAAHLQPVTSLVLTPNNLQVLSGAADSNIHVWSLERALSFSRAQLSDSSALPRPAFSFGEHRSAIISMISSNSHFSTNTAFSVSEDDTIHRWSSVNGQIFTTIFSQKPVTSLCLDPADRALYLGHKDGSVTFQDLMVSSQAAEEAIELLDIDHTRDTWSSSETSSDAVTCMTLTYDGTILLTGHRSGRILSWNVAKRAFFKVLAKLEDPVTNIIMSFPEGLSKEYFAIGNVVIKPRLELSNSMAPAGMSSIPSDYTINGKLSGRHAEATDELGITEDGWPDHILREGIEALRPLSASSES